MMERNYNWRLPLWIGIFVLFALALDNLSRLSVLIQQRKQLNLVGETLKPVNEKSAAAMEQKLEAVSLDLLQMATTNLTARQVAREFNIKWSAEMPPTDSSPVGRSLKK